jgi:methylmalonyl-CoA mutase
MSAHSFCAGFHPTSEAEWRARVDAVLKGGSFDNALVGHTADGLRIEPLYPRKAGAVAQARPRAGQRWRVCQRVDHPDGFEAAEQARDDLENGADGLILVFKGCRSARGYGLAAGTVEELDAALQGIDLALIGLRIEPRADGIEEAGLFDALAERRNLDPSLIEIDFGIDPIGTLARTGIGHSGTDLGEVHRRLRKRGYRSPLFLADGRPYHEAGASEAQEVAAIVSTALAYLRALEAGGVALDEARTALGFLITVDTDEFLSIAKIRALRQVWARIEESCGLVPRPIFLHAETAWRMLSRQDSAVNLLRNTVACFSAGTGGADAISVLPFSSALGLPDAFARRLSRNTHTVLLEEANLWRVNDPAAGAGGFEALTEALAKAAWTLFADHERQGGLPASLASGKFQAQIAAMQTTRQRLLAEGKLAMIGTTLFPNAAETEMHVLPIPAEAEAVRPSGALPSIRLSEAFELEGAAA